MCFFAKWQKNYQIFAIDFKKNCFKKILIYVTLWSFCEKCDISYELLFQKSLVYLSLL